MSSPLLFDEALRRRTESRLRNFDVHHIDDPALRAASVCLALLPAEDSDEACFLLTYRPEGLRRHGAQFALPGGRVDPGETDAAAALRELDEELGIQADESAILGVLDDFATRSGFRIRPFVVWLENDVHITPDPDEVQEYFQVPLSDLLRPAVPMLRSIPESERQVLSTPLQSIGHVVHAPTAALLYQFREVALLGRDTRVRHVEQPTFAWK